PLPKFRHRVCRWNTVQRRRCRHDEWRAELYTAAEQERDSFNGSVDDAISKLVCHPSRAHVCGRGGSSLSPSNPIDTRAFGTDLRYTGAGSEEPTFERELRSHTSRHRCTTVCGGGESRARRPLHDLSPRRGRVGPSTALESGSADRTRRAAAAGELARLSGRTLGGQYQVSVGTESPPASA